MAWITRSLPIHLVFQDDCIRYVKLKSRSPLVIQKVGEKRIPPGMIQEGKITNMDELTRLLNTCVNEWKIKRKKVRFSIPDAITVIRKIPVPSTIPPAELSGYVNVELGASIHIPFEEPVFDLHKLGQSEGQTDYLLFAAPEVVMREYVDVLEAAKLKPVDAELSSLASYRLFYKLDLVDSKMHYLALNLDRNGINATAFNEHSPVFTRFISLTSTGTKNVSELQMDRVFFDIEDHGNEMTTEIERVMNFYQFTLSDGAAVDALLITGDHPQMDLFEKWSSSTFNLPLIQVPPDKVKLNRGMEVPVQFYTAIGLGLKGE
ncbi:type IV pilus biogenesis protein PilM [Pseudalkalibacillus sp. Hm43]|uniref:type IV pilus biogenesis protein PilM n=1 Tax=Pseudalkalibacillus sp. Hm43 TaxID=3450742 RepID=UPI003F428A21